MRRGLLFLVLVVVAGMASWLLGSRAGWLSTQVSAPVTQAGHVAERPRGTAVVAPPPQASVTGNRRSTAQSTADASVGGVKLGHEASVKGGADPRGGSPRSAYDVARLFWRVPTSVTVEKLFASSFLNACGTSPDPAEIEALDVIVRSNVATISDYLKKSVGARHGAAFALLDQGKLTELRLSDLSPAVSARIMSEIGVDLSEEARGHAIKSKLASYARAEMPDTATVLVTDKSVFVASKMQLKEYDDPADFQKFLRGSFLGDCLAFFVNRSRLSVDAAGDCMSAFEAMAQ